ncbi:GGDEF domain-containing protein [Comamonas terrigena]|uniref:GGDEF domain-containing protein n=1 Tax=Comamonas terrigena TaxID=32013 RepID=UPI002447023C|nr:GGDEF domain-containing protein [Comamonas terrigena]MDH1701481.1 GGDEF domain-containing protein [Comamonas terrigena]
MFSLPDRYFALLVPLCVLLLAAALVVCWGVLRQQRQQRYLLWLAAGYALSAIGLGWQSLLDSTQFALWAPVTGVLYLGGAWSLARGIAGRYGKSAHPRVALVIAVAVLSALYYYGHVQDRLLVRMHWLNAGLGLMQILPMRGILRSQLPDNRLERALRMSFLVFACYTMVRPLLILMLAPGMQGNDIPRSVYWLITLAGSLLFALWFTMLVVACSVRDVFAQLHEERNRDPLTRLLNRRAFMEAANGVLRDRRSGPWAVVVGDIDHFKQVNDNWGHACGDQVLQQTSLVLQQQVRQGDLVARFGGEEFVLLLQRASLDDAQGVVQRMRQQLESADVAGLPNGRRVTVSFGIAPVQSLEQLSKALSRADALLYEAKQAGRNRVRVDAEAQAAGMVAP